MPFPSFFYQSHYLYSVNKISKRKKTMKYLKLFDNHSGYSEYLVSTEYMRPNVSHCVQENDVHYTVPIDWTKEYLTIESLEDNNGIVLKVDNTSISRTISYSINNGKTWSRYTSSRNTNPFVTINKGEKVLIKGENSTYATSTAYVNTFSTSKKFKISGNIMSLVSGDTFANANELTANYTFTYLFYGCTGLTSAENLILPTTTLTQYCYNGMFSGCTSLTTAPVLSATTLANHCYGNMFSGCRKLTTAPELPATTLAQHCYDSMFSGCESLTIAPELPALNLAGGCYYEMFSGCESLTTAPELPATALPFSCYYYMFTSCKNLTTAPELPATTLASSCYEGMFQSCTSLTTAPELPATTLAVPCYRKMFYNCKNLTTAPELPATTLASSCYESMFSYCTSLDNITCLATNISATDCTKYWTSGVAASGTFTKAASMTSWTTGVNGIPTGWTVQDAT